MNDMNFWQDHEVWCLAMYARYRMPLYLRWAEQARINGASRKA